MTLGSFSDTPLLNFPSTTPLQLFIMVPPPAHVSNRAIANFVYALPENMAPQPSLTRFWCRGSVTRLTTKSFKDPDGTMESFIVVLRSPDGYGVRKNNFGVCSGCSGAKEGACIEVITRSFPDIVAVLTRVA